MEYLDFKGLQLPLLALGTFSIEKSTIEVTLKAAVDCGYSLIDTASKYDNEKAIGDALLSIGVPRDNVLLESKVAGLQLLGNKRFFHLNKKSISRTYKESCLNLRTDHLDIYLLHSFYNGCERHYRDLIELQQNEGIKLIGICNVGIEQIKRIKEQTGEFPQIVQIEMHPYYTNKEMLSFCIDNGIIVEARSPLVHGDALKEWNEVPILKSLSQDYNKSVPQIVLRWAVQQNVIALPRSNNLQHIKDDIDIFDFELNAHEMAEIDSLNRNQSFGCKSRRTNSNK